MREAFFSPRTLVGLEGKVSWERSDGLSASIPWANPGQSDYLHPGIGVLVQEVLNVPKSQSSVDDPKMQISPGGNTVHAIEFCCGR